MAGCLGETLPDSVGYVSPFPECDVYFLGILSLLPGDSTQERKYIIGHLVLDGRTVPDGIHISQRSSEQTQVTVGFQSVLVVLSLELV